MWVVKFRPDHKEESVKVYADYVDMMNMPMIYIHGIRQKFRSTNIVLPQDDNFQELLECDPVIIPFHNIVHIGQLKDEVVVTNLEVVKN